MIFKTIMIRDKNNPVSMKYATHCSRSWGGFDLRFYDAITPETLGSQSGLSFGTRGNGRSLTDTEKACFYSQYNLWKKCSIENVPMLILEHDAWLENPSAINFNSNLEVQFFGQHAMEGVMFHPRFARRLVNWCASRDVSGPMQLVDTILGYFKKGTQSRHGLPHARYMGLNAPVKSVIDPSLGTTVDHDGKTSDRIARDRDLFLIVDIPNARTL